MFEGLLLLLSLGLVMATASFLAGSLPLTFSLTPSQLRLVTTLGMGVLVGTSLIVIIPEGIETLYSAEQAPSSHHTWGLRSSHALDVPWLSGMLNERRTSVKTVRDEQEPAPIDVDAFHALPGPVLPDVALPPPTPHVGSNGVITSSHPAGSSTDEGRGGHKSTPAEDGTPRPSPHAYVGLSLIVGFILMYLIDQLPRHASARSHTRQQPYHISLDNLARGLYRASPRRDGGEEEQNLETAASSRQSRSLSTTIGLVIHAAADGIALGASSSTPNTNLGLIVFLAIMVHKAPAAFGLTSVLLKQGLTKREARAHLIIFSLAAPVGAIATWTLLGLLGRGPMGGEASTQWWTGILLLFSAGTFLYVAMHTMQEENPSGHHEPSNGYADGGGASGARREAPTMRDTAAAVVGMLLPLLTQIGHQH
ncbi:MAG: hypothetical protein M1838_002768 [Thelocarpon superellum]|nr:MAG: hypothetical protein M1838_002768 [Thelocarpon superellum]